MEWNEAIIAAVAGGVGILITKGIDFLRANRGEGRADQKQNAEIELTDTDKAVGIQRELIAELKKDLAVMDAQIHKLEEERLACREEAAALRTELKFLKRQLSVKDGS